jgi:phosphatidate phosphatase PAH1
MSRKHLLLTLVLAGATFAGCSDDAAPPGSGEDGGVVGGHADAATGPDASTPPTRPKFQRCTGLTFTSDPAGAWTSSGSALTVLAGAPNHSAQDVFAVDGSAGTLESNFAYGALSASLSGETIEVYLDECTGSWQKLGEATTDSSGHITFDVPEALPIGQYEARFRVVGDASTVLSNLWVLPVGTHLVVTDIDGTMTSSDSELFQQILNGSYVPMAYPDAVTLTKAHTDLGHLVVYLTGRPTGLMGKTRDWLTMLGFAVGPVHVTDSFGQVLPTEAGVGTFKKDFLQGLLDKGFVIDLAYGNATTDIFAYLGVNLPPTSVWIIGANAGMMGTNAVTDSWTARAAEVMALPKVDQPFDW